MSVLSDGPAVGFGMLRRLYGAFAEKTVVVGTVVSPVQEGGGPAVAVVPDISIKTAAGFTPCETVLIQGKTGVAGRLTVKVARLLGAGRIVATGRDNDALREVQVLGADTVISTAVPDDDLAETFTVSGGYGYDIILDYLCPTAHQVLLQTLVPSSFTFPRRHGSSRWARRSVSR